MRVWGEGDVQSSLVLLINVLINMYISYSASNIMYYFLLTGTKRKNCSKRMLFTEKTALFHTIWHGQTKTVQEK